MIGIIMIVQEASVDCTGHDSERSAAHFLIAQLPYISACNPTLCIVYVSDPIVFIRHAV